ncbi:bacteriophage abortive infection AbiH family protein [Pseudomonas sp. B21-032]|uniref:bacteriophage abortive infection AbiH family protein n=1 Tax=Pseudomonas sp. B21-032 TaxID=2895483 RepID=UPI00215E13D3|nr:bacteriophage abortive infection AbiH family protein [Pseudomonas sp. B21-032]UVL62562.1 bacteriophage abortive infection AbiH family protein [Pseudomonas sp. B21-032]
MSTLHIIGNGFDLWHGLPTSYDSFYVFAKDMLDELESFYLIDTVKNGPWSDFENSLGKFDWQLLYEAHDYTDITGENFRPSEAYGLEDDLTEQADAIVDAIKERFHDWIEEIDVSSASPKTSFPETDFFLSFNYTSTLQLVYGIDNANIVHIHGRSDAYDELIFGHGETREEESEVDENGDSNRTMFSDAEGAAKYPFYALQKPVSDAIKNNREFFDSLGDYSTISIIGHSLNDIDLPYFEEIAKNTNNAKWTIYCYRIEDKDHYLKQLIKCGVDGRNITIETYDKLPSA